ncbi:MAG: tyrosine-type recombinase/integrase [Candidatus Dojkabacteria bacterium]|nr:MAG: tyrosine-type recombinase/integrase [Candidatus Dojkabacteria bacterium]
MRKISIQQLTGDDKRPKLGHQNEFLLHLYNNNYSDETVYNYNRDLTFFAEYLVGEGVSFAQVTKLTVTYFKGWLKERKHISTFLENERKRNDTQVAKEKPTSAGDVAKNGPKSNDTQSVDRNSLQNTKKGGFVKNNNPETLDALSVNRILVSLRNYLRFLVEYDYPAPIPPDAVQLVRIAKKKPQVPTLDEVIALVEAPTQYEPDEEIALRNRAALELLLATGMRISEVVSINRDQVNSDGKLFITGKGKKQRFVYLTPRAVGHIHAYVAKRGDSYPALFLPKSGSRRKGADPRLSTNYLQMKIAHYRRILEIVVPMSAHSIRHAYATYLAENGANPAAIQVLLGHESLQTTTRYVHTSDKFAEDTHYQFHPAKEKD